MMLREKYKLSEIGNTARMKEIPLSHPLHNV